MDLATAGPALDLKRLELTAKGYSEKHVNGAIRYAWRRAEGIAAKANPAYREGAFMASLEENLEACGRWIDGNLRAAREGDMAEGIDAAAAHARYERGYRRAGFDVGPDKGKWAAAGEASKAAYLDFWTGA